MTPKDEANELRQAAESRLKASKDMARLDYADQARLVHELQVHQIELEIQNAELREARDNLEIALTEYTELYDFAPVGYFTLDRRGHILKLNVAAQRLLGGDSTSLSGKTLQHFVAPEDQRKFALLLQRALSPAARCSADLTLLTGDAPPRRIHVQSDAANNPRDETFRLAAMDVTERNLADDARRLSESKFNALYSAMSEGMALHEMVLDLHGNPIDYILLDVNPAYESILGLDRAAVIGCRGSQVYGLTPPPHLEQFAAVASTGHPILFETLEDPAGRVFSISAFSPAPNQFATVFVDITAQRALQRQLERIAHFDSLTGLPNRVLLADRLRQAMYLALRHGKCLAVAFIDLDGFKAVNDQYGHDVGDDLLARLAVRMKHALREGDTLARLGGDEFIAVMGDLANVEASTPMLERLLDAAAEPFQANGVAAKVSASIGVSFFPQIDDIDADQLLRQADQAMYQAKLAGKGRYQLFDARQDRSARDYHDQIAQIRLGLERSEFLLFYQPKVNMRTGKVIGLEALIRWQHPIRGLLSPAVFLPLIEDHPLTVDMGEWVINSALIQIETWLAQGLDIPVSVNIGALQLQQPNFIERLRNTLAAHPDVKPGSLELEVLETSALQDVSKTSRVISTCSEMGVRFALDDFGTGYSSLTYLMKLPAEILKIDQSFVHDLLMDPEALAILEGVIGLATAFQRQSIAEGLDSVETGIMLMRLGCEQAQGYVISPPMPADRVPDWVAGWQPDPRWAATRVIRPDQLPLLHAEVEHRAWLAAIKVALDGPHAVPLRMCVHPCRFEAWLATERGAQLLLKCGKHELHDMHRALHDQAEALVLRHEQGERTEELEPELGVFLKLKHEFLSCLEALISSDVVPPARR
ncbi:diguanylate cyclase [Parazoarcus communis]|uniref:Diguanylate cyclase n=1 Tax=Parazoarcus communis TaxID=41977 RepID=A0A2U8GMA0_9RHOO|nr:bifunctional diguanylate cyclase/phosphodiesterase [Parazoarcus communis]AWI74739.1 diguanylate cyclase [Parazoarcus communis]